MRRYWLDSDSFQDDRVVVQGDAFRHICEVCRQEVGDRFEVLGIPGQVLVVDVISVKKNRLEAEIRERRAVEDLPRPWIHLGLLVPRLPVFDAVVEKSVEMGVKSIQPLFGELSFFRSNSAALASRKDRWERIITSSSQQCGRSERMAVRDPLPLRDFVGHEILAQRRDEVRALFAYEGHVRGPEPLALNLSLRDWEKQKLRDVWLIIGGEGGFSLSEAKFLSDSGLGPATFGRQVLRVETACVVGLSVLRYELGLMVMGHRSAQ